VPGDQPSDISADSVREQLARLLRSQAFANAPSLSRFLAHIVERTLDGRRDELKEYALGVDVFGRGDRFDPKIDTIVRVQARRLRFRLQDYYEAEGRGDAIAIGLAKGHYIPEFTRRRPADSSSVIRLVVREPTDYRQPTAEARGELNRHHGADATDQAGQAPAPIAGIDSAVSRRHQPRRSRAISAAVGLIVIGVAATGLVLSSRRPIADRTLSDSLPAGTALASRVTPIASQSLAVLPFQQLDSTNSDDLQGIGMADSLISRLGLLQNLAVRPLASVRLYAGGQQDPEVAGRELHVDSVLDGSLQANADRVRVRVRLYRVSDGRLLWAEQFDQPARDLFALQDSISEKVATALSLLLNVKSRPAVDRQAYESYVRGRYFFEEFTREGNVKAVEYFENAIRIQPDWGAAYSGLALNYCPMIMRGFISVADGTPKLRTAVERAMSLDDSQPEAYAALATLRWLDFDWAGAEQALKRALALNPSYLHAYGWYTYLLDMMGREDEALSLRQRELEIDPVSDYAAKDLGTGLILLGRYGEAVEQLKRALELRPGFVPAQSELGVAYRGLHQLDDAYRTFVGAGDVFGAAYVRAMQGDPAPARLLIDRYAVSDFRTRIGLAGLHTALGEKAPALALLERAFDERDAGVLFLKTDGRFAPLRGEARFQTLIARLRFP